MPQFDRKKFWKGFKDRIDASVEQEQVDGLEFLLGKMEADPFWKHIPQISYALATVGHETAWSFQPVEEGYYLGSAARVKRFQKTLRYFPWFGRGYVQLTWEKNYRKAAKALGVDFIADPSLVMKPEHSYAILTLGMHQGWFTGKKLDDYIKGTKKDYRNARRIINGTDKAALIAGYAEAFEKILKDSASTSQKAATADSPARPVPGATRTEDEAQQYAATNRPDAPSMPNESQQDHNTVGEITAKKETETPTGTETLEVTSKNEQDVNTPASVTAPEPYQGVGFWGVIKRDLAAATGGNLSFSALAEYAQQASGWPEWVVGLISKIAIGALIATFGYFVFRIVHYIADTWKKNQKTKIEAEAATSTVRKDIQWEPPK